MSTYRSPVVVQRLGLNGRHGGDGIGSKMPNQPSLWVDGRGFLRYGIAKLPVRVVNGLLEFKVGRADYKPRYGPYILVEVEELASLCSRKASGLDSESKIP